MRVDAHGAVGATLAWVTHLHRQVLYIDLRRVPWTSDISALNSDLSGLIVSESPRSEPIVARLLALCLGDLLEILRKTDREGFRMVNRHGNLADRFHEHLRRIKMRLS